MLPKELTDALRGRDSVCVAQLQTLLDISYSDARRTVAYLGENKYAAKKPEGVMFRLNKYHICPRELTEDECMNIGLSLDKTEYECLTRLTKYITRKKALERHISFRREKYDSLIEKGLAYYFEGELYSSLSVESIEKIKKWLMDLSEVDVELRAVALPVLLESIRNSTAPSGAVMESLFLPEKSKNFINAGVKKYAEDSKDLVSINLKVSDQELRKLSYELIEAFLYKKYYASKQSYVRSATRQLQLLANDAGCPPLFYRACEMAVDQIRNELSYSNMIEIRKIMDAPD